MILGRGGAVWGARVGDAVVTVFLERAVMRCQACLQESPFLSLMRVR